MCRCFLLLRNKKQFILIRRGLRTGHMAIKKLLILIGPALAPCVATGRMAKKTASALLRLFFIDKSVCLFPKNC